MGAVWPHYWLVTRGRFLVRPSLWTGGRLRMRTSTPNIIWLTEGTAEGDTTLNAFDNALLAAGIGNWNLVKVTSVAPQAAQLLKEPVDIEPGAIVPVVLSEARSD